MEPVQGRADAINGKQRHGLIRSVERAFEGRFARLSNPARAWQGEGG